LVLELDSKQKDNEAMVQLLLSQLLIRIGRLAGEAEASQKPQADIYINQATSYIHHHYDCEIQVKDIASAVNLHPGYLQRIFKASMGCTLVEYLTRLRIEKAKMLLTQTDIPVIEISQNVGFNNRQHFSSIFKKITSQSPGQYRKSVHVMSKHQYRLPLTDK
jgi:YesN/AraC family two-component response regulator